VETNLDGLAVTVVNEGGVQILEMDSVVVRSVTIDEGASVILEGHDLGAGLSRHVTLRWDAVADATWYRVWIGKLDGQGVVEENVYDDWTWMDPTWTAEFNMVGGEYRVWIQPWNPVDAHGTWFIGTEFTVPVSPAQATVLLGPNGSISQQRPQFQWEAALHATWYRLWVARDGVVVIDQWVQDTSYTPAFDLAWGDYTMWVRTWGVEGFGPWTGPGTFQIGTPVPVTGSSTQLRWNDAGSADATWYYIWLNRNGTNYDAFWVYRGDTTAGAGNERFYTFDPALTNGQYTWWVQAWNPANGAGAWSEGSIFAVP